MKIFTTRQNQHTENHALKVTTKRTESLSADANRAMTAEVEVSIATVTDVTTDEAEDSTATEIEMNAEVEDSTVMAIEMTAGVEDSTVMMTDVAEVSIVTEILADGAETTETVKKSTNFCTEKT